MICVWTASGRSFFTMTINGPYILVNRHSSTLLLITQYNIKSSLDMTDYCGVLWPTVFERMTSVQTADINYYCPWCLTGKLEVYQCLALFYWGNILLVTLFYVYYSSLYKSHFLFTLIYFNQSLN